MLDKAIWFADYKPHYSFIVSKLKLWFFFLFFSEKMMLKIVSSKSSSDATGKIIHFSFTNCSGLNE